MGDDKEDVPGVGALEPGVCGADTASASPEAIASDEAEPESEMFGVVFLIELIAAATSMTASASSSVLGSVAGEEEDVGEGDVDSVEEFVFTETVLTGTT